MLFENTWQYTRTHTALTVFLLIVIVAINYFMTVAICPFAPGYPILIGFLGGIIGTLLAVMFTPESKIVGEIAEATNFILQSL